MNKLNRIALELRHESPVLLEPPQDLRVRRSPKTGQRRWIKLIDQSNDLVGIFHPDIELLQMFQEGHRLNAVQALLRGVPLPDRVIAGGDAPLDACIQGTVFPDQDAQSRVVKGLWRVGVLPLGGHSSWQRNRPPEIRSLPKIAAYDHPTDSLYVIAEEFVAPATALLKRHGIRPSRVQVVTRAEVPRAAKDPMGLRLLCYTAARFDNRDLIAQEQASAAAWAVDRASQKHNFPEAVGRLAPGLRDSVPLDVRHTIERDLGQRSRSEHANNGAQDWVWSPNVRRELIQMHNSITLPADAASYWRTAMAQSKFHAPILATLESIESDPYWWASIAADAPPRDIAFDLRRDQSPRAKAKRLARVLPPQLHRIQTIPDRRGDRTIVWYPWLPQNLSQFLLPVVRVATSYARDFDLAWGAEIDIPIECRVCGTQTFAYQQRYMHIRRFGSNQYCPQCMSYARTGLYTDPTQEAELLVTYWAFATLAAEWGGAPPKRVADWIRLPDTESETTRDLGVLARRYIPRGGQGQKPWQAWLAEAGIVGSGSHRSFMGTWSTAQDGHTCRSMLERYVDDWLSKNGIQHQIEPTYPFHDSLNPAGLRADWKLADGTLVEAAGLMSRSEYAAKIERKRALATHFDLSLIIVTETDLDRLPSIFSDHMPARAVD